MLVAPFFFYTESMSFASLSLGIIHVLEGEPTMNYAIRFESQLGGIQVFEFVSYEAALNAALIFGASLHRVVGRIRSSNEPVLMPAP